MIILEPRWRRKLEKSRVSRGARGITVRSRSTSKFRPIASRIALKSRGFTPASTRITTLVRDSWLSPRRARPVFTASRR